MMAQCAMPSQERQIELTEPAQFAINSDGRASAREENKLMAKKAPKKVGAPKKKGGKGGKGKGGAGAGAGH
jgi:hypothetical protein